jgi:hypothetical protein
LWRAGRVLGEGGDEDRLHLVAHDRGGDASEQVAKRGRRLRAVRRDDASIRPGQRERKRRTAARPRVVEQERRPDGRLGGQPRLEVGDAVHAADLDASGVHDGGGQRRGEVVGRLERPLDRRARRIDRGDRRPGDRVEVEAEL